MRSPMLLTLHSARRRHCMMLATAHRRILGLDIRGETGHARCTNPPADRAARSATDVRPNRIRVLTPPSERRPASSDSTTVSTPHDLPSNAEIRDHIQSLANLYEGDKRTQNLRDMRLAALRMMRLLSQFRPR